MCLPTKSLDGVAFFILPSKQFYLDVLKFYFHMKQNNLLRVGFHACLGKLK